MTTAADIEVAWTASVWTADSVEAFSSLVLTRAISEFSEAETSPFHDHDLAEINFFSFVVTRKPLNSIIAGGTTGSTQYQFDVRVSYYRTIDAEGTNHDLTRDGIEAVDDVVRSALGKTWGGTVDFFEYGDTKPPTRGEVDGTPVWEASQTYRATKIF